MPRYSCRYEPNAKPWKPQEITDAAKAAIVAAGGTVTWTNPVNKYHFTYKCDAAIIHGNIGEFRGQVKISKLVDKTDTGSYEVSKSAAEKNEEEAAEEDTP
ncbi:unnamed protein product [Zymoseptoria tritici ST99CH_3D7]|uniref:Uncharacterized protein n=1 Tax=Zymoseptoria tritici (strain ST99CH_3D7) TaxID=1276538 RepID=A0A1X7RDJ4_ZYMT9|nr:unnamed protein product [Zymoseptoria tritici ST99CH_3D7]